MCFFAWWGVSLRLTYKEMNEKYVECKGGKTIVNIYCITYRQTSDKVGKFVAYTYDELKDYKRILKEEHIIFKVEIVHTRAQVENFMNTKQ